MAEMQFFFREDTLQIDAVYRDCKTSSSVFKDPDVYVEVNVTDPLYDVTRDHKVILGSYGRVITTEYSLNPVQPAPAPNPNQGIIDDLNAGFEGTGMPEKLNALREALLRLLG